jgi:IclR family acetate operon transcriptional repressor
MQESFRKNMSQTQKANRYNVRVLDRAIRILYTLSDGAPRTLTQLSQAIGLSSSTTFRLLATLSFHDLVQRNEESGSYTLGLGCLELARHYLTNSDIRREALPELERLRDESAESVHLAIMDKMEVVYLEKLQGLHGVGLMSSRVGGRAPAHCTGLGKVLLAYTPVESVREHYAEKVLDKYSEKTITCLDKLVEHLREVRRQGYAFDLGEHEPEIRCIAAPVYDFSGRVVGAISVSGTAPRLDPVRKNQALISRVVQTACAISARLGYREQSQNDDHLL